MLKTPHKRKWLKAAAMLVIAVAIAAVLGGAAARATNATSVVYDAVPSTLPANVASVGFQATSTSEFGDYVHLGGSNRALRSVTVTMSDWALYSDYTGDSRYSGDPSNWTHTITLNVYSSHLGANGAPDTLLASKTQTVTIPWRPAADPGTDPGQCGVNSTQWYDSATQTCNNGLAFNVTFDLGSSNVTLPDDVIVGVAYNTETYGASPIGSTGPYDSLNVGVASSQTASVGSDDSADNVFWNTSHGGFYTDGGAAGVGIFRQDTNWTPNGTVNMQITAAPTVPSDVYVNSSWSGVPNGQDPDGSGPASQMGYDAFASIQLAVNAAASGGTVNVAAGTQPAGFTVSGKSDLTIAGAGAGSTTIQPSTLISSGITHKYTGNMQASVVVNNSTNVTISGMTITGNGSAPGAGGPDALVLWNGSTGTLQNDDITGDYTINGDQTGQGIAVDGSSGTVSLAVNDTNVSGFQKNGIDVIDGNGATSGATDTTTLNVSGGSITGAGSTGTIAQNGIVLWNRGIGSVSGSVNGTTISGFHFTPLDIPGGDYATGVLTYGTNSSATVTQSTLTDSDLDVVNATSAGTLSATNDWWGTVSGPGTIDQVTTKPWATDASFATQSDNADLTSLSLSGGTLDPTFSSGTTNYAANVDNSVTSVTVNKSLNPGATATVGGASGLLEGNNSVVVTVTSADGSATKTYTVTVNRAAAPAPPTTTTTETTPPVTSTTPNQAVSVPVDANQAGSTQVVVAPTSTPAGESPSAPVTVATSWSPQTFTVPVTVQVTPKPELSAPTAGSTTPPAVAGGFSVGSTTVQLTVTDSSGVQIHQFAAPLVIHISASQVGDVPAYSQDGKTWVTIPRLDSPNLPDGQQDGYFRNTDGSIDIYTRHATYFGLLKDSQAPSAPTLSMKATKAGLRLSWKGSKDNVRVTGYVVSLNGHGYKATTRATVLLPLKAGLYVVRARDASGNVSKASTTVRVVRRGQHFVVTKS